MKDKLLRLTPFVILLAGLAIGLSILPVVTTSTPAQETPYCGGTIDTEPTIYSNPEPDSTSREIASGEVLFKENCKTCHSIHTQEVGPALRGLLDRRSKKWAKQFIRNAELLISKKDTAAIHLSKKFGHFPHTKFEDLTDQEIEDILAYISSQHAVQSFVKYD